MRIRTTMRLSFIAILLILVIPTASNALAQTGDYSNLNRFHTQQSVSGNFPTDQIIVKYKDTANLQGLMRPDSVTRMSQLAEAAGVSLEFRRALIDNVYVLKLPQRLAEGELQTILDRLMQLGDVEYVEPDRILQPVYTPNDTYYTSQWDLFEIYGINAPAAWDITQGSSSVNVAVIDTGITSHTDLTGRVLAGYDFISDYWTANDNDPSNPIGSNRDSDPSDPGDWVAAGDCGNNPAEASSWHGTHVAGTIGAASNNSTGVTGINWVSKIVPVRVLGRCGGYETDILDGMKWAAGLTVSGVPANSNPVKVMNISLGGIGSCDSTAQTYINQIISAGVTIVVAAGNNSTNASSFFPANCSGVIAVAATDRSGNKAWYSNYGSVVSLAAPGGDTSSVSSNGIRSTINAGATYPTTPTYEYYQGTSMATPHVTGVASLLYSLDPDLTPSQVKTILENTATAFAGGSSCATTYDCGSGLLNAGAAVGAMPRITSLSPGFVETGSSNFTLTVYGVNFINGANVLWNGSARTTSYISSSELQATILATDVASAGNNTISVSENHPTYGTLTTLGKNFFVGEVTYNYLPLVMNNYVNNVWVSIINEHFDGDFPGSWDILDASGSGYYWNQRNCRAFSGLFSAWVAGGGTYGGSLGCGSSYANNMETWLSYGPFDLSRAVSVDMNYKLWLNTDYNSSTHSGDMLCKLASTNDIDYYGYCYGGSSNGWISDSFDLTHVPTGSSTYIDLRGQSQVWVGYYFASDGFVTVAEGGYVDDVVLRRCDYSIGCTGSTSASIEPLPDSLHTVPIHLKRTK